MHTSVRGTRTETVVLGFGVSWSSYGVHFPVFPLSRGGVLLSFLRLYTFATVVIYIPGGESGCFGRFGSSFLRGGLAYRASRSSSSIPSISVNCGDGYIATIDLHS